MLYIDLSDSVDGGRKLQNQCQQRDFQGIEVDTFVFLEDLGDKTLFKLYELYTNYFGVVCHNFCHQNCNS